MTTRAPQWFETWYNDQITHALQSQGFLTRGMTTDTDNIKANVARWRTAGAGTATAHPAGHSQVPVMNVDRDYVEATIADFDADDLIKTRDIEKMSANEKQAVVESGKLAIGRKYDDLLLDTLVADAVANSKVLGAEGAALTSPTVALVAEAQISGVQRNMGDIYCAIPKFVMSNWCMYEQFANSQWTGDTIVPKMTVAKTWMGINFFTMEDAFFTSRAPAANNIYLFMWNKRCVGRHMNKVGVDGIFYRPDYKDWRVGQSISGVAKTILPEGIRLIKGLMPTTVSLPA